MGADVGMALSGRRVDYSEWLTQERFEREDELWSGENLWLRRDYAGLLQRWCPDEAPRVLEYGCGSGLVAQHLSGHYAYLGVDANPYCVERARERNPGRVVLCEDLRRVELGSDWGVVCAFALLKHFSLDEWDAVARKVLESARTAVFTMTVADEDREDNCVFPHVWVSRKRLVRVIWQAGHRLVETDSDQAEREWTVITSRR